MQPLKFGVGQSVVRKEDDPLLRGRGRYVADTAPRGTLHAVVLRSPHAHAGFRIDADEVRAMPGVRLVLTGADTAELGPLPCSAAFPDATVDVPRYPILPRDEVRHVGDAIAFVVADTPDRAKDAAEAIAVDWQARPHVVGIAAALKPDAPRVWPQHGSNVAFDVALGDQEATARAFAQAAKIVALTLVNQRLVSNYLDTRGVIAEYDAAGDRLTLTLSSQGSHAVRDVLAGILHVPAQKLRVVTPDVGGGFGTKLFCYREYALAAVAAKRLREPVTWIADRSEHFPAMRRAATTSRRRGWRSTTGIASSRSMSISSPTWALICRNSRRSFLISAPVCRPASTISRPAMSACAASIPTPFRSTPIAAPVGPRRLTSSSGWLTLPRAKSELRPMPSGGAISSSRAPCRTGRRSAKATIPAISPRIYAARRSSPIGPDLKPG